MPITPRKSEVELVKEAIKAATPDGLDAAAKAALKAAYAAFQSRPAPGEKLQKGLWVVATSEGLLFGPFSTEAEATKAVENGKIPDLEALAGRAREEGYVPTREAHILPMTGPIAMAEKAIQKDREARQFALHLCAACDHPTSKHSHHDGTCIIPGCGCKKPKPVTL